MFVYSNIADEIGNEKSIGHSQITIPIKGVLKSMNHNKEAMFIQEVDTSILKDAEKAYKIRSNLKKRIF